MPRLSRVIAGDCLREMMTLARKGTQVDAVVTDPPYHLAPMDKRHLGREIDKPGGYFRSLSTGFMNKTWDGGDIAFRPETWATIAAVLKPGGYLLAFGGSRTHHRIWCAIEDAGFVIQDTIMWLYGQGFPKGRTQLKPAFEPIVVAYKPGGPRLLQLDACRIGTSKRVPGSLSTTPNNVYGEGLGGSRQSGSEGGHNPNLGRWPGNVCHDGSDEVMEAFAAFGVKSSGVLKAGQRRAESSRQVNCYGRKEAIAALRDFGGDTGTAARFFYCAKANKADRAGSKHPTIKPIALMRWLVRLVTPPGGVVLDPFAGSGTTGAAARADGRRAILIEREPEYIADIRRRLKAA